MYNYHFFLSFSLEIYRLEINVGNKQLWALRRTTSHLSCLLTTYMPWGGIAQLSWKFFCRAAISWICDRVVVSFLWGNKSANWLIDFCKRGWLTLPTDLGKGQTVIMSLLRNKMNSDIILMFSSRCYCCLMAVQHELV